MTMQELEWWNESLTDEEQAPLAVEQVAQPSASRAVAIIGMSVRLPQADSLAEWWSSLRQGQDAVGQFPQARRIDVESLLSDTRLPDGQAGYYDGAYLERIDAFDHRFFRLSPKEASLISPNQRIWLETAWEALEDAGYGGDRLRGTRTGVYMGYNGDSFHDYKRLIAERDPSSLSLAIPGNLSAVTAGRLSYLLDFKGPSMAVDTACSSSLVALHLAIQSIRSGECDQAVVGGVKTYLLPVDLGIRIGIESHDAKARTFDAASDGTGGGEGCAAILIKPLDQALRDGDAIHAVIRGSAINQDGASIGLTAPNARAQEEVIAAAWEDAGIDPETVGYIEAHGTGTKLGDPIEVSGITNAFARYTDRKQFCAVGSVKTNIGHLDTAAGIVGLVKTVLTLRSGELPPLVHYRSPNPEIPFERSPLYIPASLQAWPRVAEGMPYRAGVSSFGMSGTNAHVVLEEAPQLSVRDDIETGPAEARLLPLSAKSRTALRALIGRYVDWLREEGAQVPLADICYTAAVGRGHYGWRIAIGAHGHEQLAAGLQQLAETLDRLPDSLTPGLIMNSGGGWLGVPRKGDEEREVLSSAELRNLTALGRVYAEGAPLDWTRLWSGASAHTVHLPVYPFDRIRCWIEEGTAELQAGYRKPADRIADLDAANTVEGSSELTNGSDAAPVVQLTGRADSRYSRAEQLVAEAWSTALGLSSIGVEEDFFEAGGDSILALRVASALEASTGASFSAVDVILQPTVAELAELLEEQLPPSLDESVEVEMSIAADRDVMSTDVEGQAEELDKLLPLSRSQRRILLSSYQPGAERYHHMTLAYTLSGSVDLDRLEQAFAALVSRHEALRTTFEWTEDGEPVQRVHPTARFRLERSTVQSEADWGSYADSFAQPFIPEQLPLMRVGLASAPSNRHLLLFDAHHLILDGASLAMLLGELVALYEQKSLPQVTAQYGDYVMRQLAWLDSEENAIQRAYWLDRTLAGPLPKLTLPLDRNRPARKSQEGGCHRFIVSADTVRAIHRIAAACRVSAHAVLLAAYSLLLSRCAGQSEVIVGSLANGRDDTALLGAAGVFINFIPIRLHIDEDQSAEAFIRLVHAASTEAHVNGRYPFDELVAELGETQDRSRSPIYDAMLVFHNHAAGSETFEAGGISFEQYPLPRTTSSLDVKLDLFIAATGELHGIWEYDAALFDESTIADMAAQFRLLCTALADAPKAELAELEPLSSAQEAEYELRRMRNDVQEPESMAKPISSPDRPIFHLHVAATFTAEPLEKHLQAWLQMFGWKPVITFAPFNQVMQDVLRLLPDLPGGAVTDSARSARLLLIRPEDWIGEEVNEQQLAVLESDLARLTTLLSERPDHAPLFIGLTPAGSLQRIEDAQRAALLSRWHRHWRETDAVHGISVVDFSSAADRYFVEVIADAVTESEGHIPYTEPYYAAMAAHLVRGLVADTQSSPFKVIAVDADNTLWRGVCGEDGAEGVTVTPGFAAVQRRLLQARSEGFLLALCSKNNESDVWDVFDRNPGMLLTRDHFAAWRIDWSSKSDHVQAIAQELNVGVDSFVFLDDNAAECLAMMAACPQVLTIKVPEDTEGQLTAFADHLWALDRVQVTEEDRRRADRYGEERKRRLAEASMSSMEQYLASLSIRVAFRTLQLEDVPRASQLTYRTNQFNSTSVRRSEEQMLQQASLGQVFVLEASDRYGDYGLVGLAITRVEGIVLRVESLMMSCRVLGRGIEHAVLDRLAAIADDRGCTLVQIDFIPSAKNAPFAAYLRSLPGGDAWREEGAFTLPRNEISSAPAHIAFDEHESARNDAVAARTDDHRNSIEDASMTNTFEAAHPSDEGMVWSWGFLPDDAQQAEALAHYAYAAALRYVTGEQLVDFAAEWSMRHTTAHIERTHADPLQSETELALAKLWLEVFGDGISLGRSDSFFDVGGDSLRAASLVSAIVRQFGVRLSLTELFVHAALCDMAILIDRKRQMGGAEAAIPRLTAAPEASHYPLTPAQRRMYVLQQFDPMGTAYNIPTVLELRGLLDEQRLAAAVNGLIERHEALRTRIVLYDGEPVQRIEAPASIDGQKVYRRQPLQHNQTVAEAASQFVHPFDLSEWPLMRIALLETAEAELHYLLFDIHHIIADGVSVNVLVEDVIRLYNEEQSKPLELQFKDYAAWLHREEKSSEELVRRQVNRLGDGLPKLELPLDYERPAVLDRVGIRYDLTIEREGTAGIHALARRTETTPFIVLLTAYAVWLMRLSGQQDVMIGAPMAGRTQPDTERLVGLFVNTVPIRLAPLVDRSFEQLLLETKPLVAKAIDGQEVPFERLVDRLLPSSERDMGRNPLFDAMFSMLNMPHAELSAVDGLSIRQLDIDFGTAQFDVGLSAIEREGKLQLTFQYAKQLFNETTMHRWTSMFGQLLRQLLESPRAAVGAHDIVDPIERQMLLHRFNDTSIDLQLGASTLTEMFRRQVQLTPERIAASYDAGQLTYRELDERSDAIAQHLLAVGVRRGDAVGLMADRSPALLAGVMGILKAGGAYVPLPPEFPVERLQFMAEDSGLQVICVQQSWIDAVESSLGDRNRLVLATTGEVIDRDVTAAGSMRLEPVTEDDLAYILFTSGSTGRPKGVMIRHGAVMNRIGWMQRAYPLDESAVILHKTPYSFDVSVWELFWWMFAGASVALAPPGAEKDPAGLLDLIERHRITTMHFVPSMLAVFNESLQSMSADKLRNSLSTLRHVFASGEALQPSHVERFYEVMRSRAGADNEIVRLINLYGPTEATVDVTVYECEPGVSLRSVPIGQPIDNTKLYVANGNGQLQPIGVPGELCIGGVQVAAGYVNRPELTAERFIPDPYAMKQGAMMYRTGDLVRWTYEGMLEYMGRIDDQVKIRGYRIELGEIERALLSCEPVSEAVAVAVEDESGNRSICAYFVADRSCTAGELRKHCAGALPSYMLPEAFVQLDKMPLTASGKADRKALPKLRIGLTLDTGTKYEGPTTETEQVLAELWQSLLQREEIGIDDEFFELGGNSLRAVALNARMEERFHIRLELLTLFRVTTIRRLAALIDEALVSQSELPSNHSFPRAQERPYYPVSAAQQRMLLHQQLQPSSLSYHMTTVLRCKGELNRDRLLRAVYELVDMHESLRTSFEQRGGQTVQIIHPKVEQLPLTIWELDEFLQAYELPPFIDDDSIDSLLERWRKPFSIREAPLFRLDALQLSDDSFLLLFDIHHAVSDGLSAVILLQDLADFYEGRQPSAPNLQQKDYTEWLHASLKDGSLSESKTWWLSQFEDGIPVRVVPADIPRSTITPRQAEQADAVGLTLSANHSDRIRALAQQFGCTPFMVLLAAYEAAYSWWTSCEDTMIGIPVAGRSHADLQRTTGLLLNVVPLRGRPISSRTFEELLADVKRRLVAVLHHSRYPAEVLVEELDELGFVKWEAARHPLFDTLFVMQDTVDSPTEAGDLSWQPIANYTRSAKLDLAVQVEERAGAYELIFEYRSAIFRAASILGLVACMERVLEGAVEAPAAALSTLSSNDDSAKTAADVARNSVNHADSAPDLFEETFDF
ncbi:amino acid adenylation domain-containing protein [Paenibacillus sp. PR3]|uniref:Amino acid adenylation domain-containing protein n=1 Tax=Paenibacillus terricola TaxID=2763503 RepID=A0ABR8MP76_9BACL|nr:non-ribosomal peptide synthetase [Paenibacillus terricola]MBD3917807.1 amino acid adenylation domain-containing protein [Paenibacillus terricola]